MITLAQVKIMELLSKIITLFTEEYQVGTEACNRAFSIFNGIGYTIIAFALISLLVVMIKGKEIEAKIVTKDKNKR